MSYIIDTARLWPVQPNWKTPLVETLEWSTTILPAHNGDEQRASNRLKARVGVDYNFLQHGSAAKRFDNLLWSSQNRQLAVPMWQYRTNLTAGISSGVTELPLDTTLSPFVAGGRVLLFKDAETFEAGVIDSLDADSITLTAPTTLAWPIGTAVYPLNFGYIDGNVPTTRATDRALFGAVRLQLDPVLTDPFVPEIAAPATYNGKEILLTKPNWNGGIASDNQYPLDRNDYTTGAVAHNRTVNTPAPVRPFRWLLKNRTAVKAFRGFLGRCNGRQKSFYAPTWTDDLELTANISSVATTISCRELLFDQLVGLDPSRKHIYIRLRSGTTYLREITSVDSTGDTLTLGISSALGANVTVADVRAIHFVNLCRLASDSVSLQWYTTQVVTAETPFVLVKP